MLHEFDPDPGLGIGIGSTDACASCTELGSTVNPAARIVAPVKAAIVKKIVFLKDIKQNARLYVKLS
jgi:hypothetical protein